MDTEIRLNLAAIVGPLSSRLHTSPARVKLTDVRRTCRTLLFILLFYFLFYSPPPLPRKTPFSCRMTVILITSRIRYLTIIITRDRNERLRRKTESSVSDFLLHRVGCIRYTDGTCRFRWFPYLNMSWKTRRLFSWECIFRFYFFFRELIEFYFRGCTRTIYLNSVIKPDAASRVHRPVLRLERFFRNPWQWKFTKSE